MKHLQRLLLVLLPLITCIGAAQNTPSLTYQLRAKDFDNSDVAQLLVTADVPSSFSNVQVEFSPSPEFAVDPVKLSFGTQPGKKIVPVTVRRKEDAGTGEYFILAHTTAQPSSTAPPLTIDQMVTFAYVRRLAIRWYFVLGLAGFVLGYILRILTGVLKKIPAPAPAPPAPGAGGDGQDGPVTRYAKAHYYRVDVFVSLVLAFVVLLYLMREGHPPDSAASWYGALLTGIGLGFLTNNDLLARIKA